MGSRGLGVEVRPNSIRLTFVFEGVEVRRTLVRTGEPAPPTPANVKWANRLALEIRDRIKHGTFSMAEYFPDHGAGVSATTLTSQLQTWLKTQRITSSTRRGYESAARFWSECQAGAKSLRAIKPSELLAAVAGHEHLSGKTINNYVSVLRKALDLAVADKLLSENPADSIQRAKWQREPPDPFTREEAEAIIADMGKHHPGQVHNLTEWWMFTGVRTSEMAGLKWPNVDLINGSFVVRETMVRGEEKDSTKTGVSREVLSNSRAAAAVQRQRQHTQMIGEHVWQDPRYGAPWADERAFRRSFWTPCLKRLGIRYRRPYNMRHTYASLMLMSGMTPAFCAKQLGHGIEMFLRTYSKWISGAQDAAEMQRLEKALTSPKPPQESKTPG